MTGNFLKAIHPDCTCIQGGFQSVLQTRKAIIKQNVFYYIHVLSHVQSEKITCLYIYMKLIHCQKLYKFSIINRVFVRFLNFVKKYEADIFFLFWCLRYCPLCQYVSRKPARPSSTIRGSQTDSAAHHVLASHWFTSSSWLIINTKLITNLSFSSLGLCWFIKVQLTPKFFCL